MKRGFFFIAILLFRSAGWSAAQTPSYEVDLAPAALFVRWLSLDVIRFENQLGYGLSFSSFSRNRNSFDGLLPSREGAAFGAVIIKDFKDYYYSAHGFYEKYNRISFNSTMIQEREGFRVNAVIGAKETLRGRYFLKYGIGFELQGYKVREYNDLNIFVQNNYNTVEFNPVFVEFKLGGFF